MPWPACEVDGCGTPAVSNPERTLMGQFLHPTPRWLIGSLAAAICLAGAGTRSAEAQIDSFMQQRDSEAAAHESSGFFIAFPDKQRVFRPGETITIVFT